ncbi:multidrug efflux SMR transporter [Helicobacter sp. MIT 05-5294]|uniref:DMT family transporter n=1 Tax=Helicobacter sp. MIT 05-5294 TaxID=1548150 RepID=UPI0010FF462B|nr:multidrug efflux SMR transporter [Helicobacter sp. MIT 05-5294]TLD87251.1 multidrug efflux SMR transporter [Helicobacter sp. MIT 05-5294]
MQSSNVSHISNNLAWVLVIAGGIVECFWASGLKYADNLLLYTLTGIGILFSFVCMVLAVKSKLEIGVVYSVFVGIGTVGIALAEIVVFGEPFSLLKIGLIVLLLIGVIGLKLSTNKEENAQEQALAEGFAKDLGLDEIVQKESK